MDDVSFKKIIVGVLGVVILIGGIWYYFYYKDVSRQISSLESKIVRLYRYKAQMPFLLRKYRLAREEFSKYSKQLPLKEEIPSLLVKLNSIIEADGVSLMSFQPKKAVRDKRGIYFIKPIFIRMRGTYLECGRVFEDVSKMERLFKVKDFTISNPKIVNLNKVMLDISFSAETYYLVGKNKSRRKRK